MTPTWDAADLDAGTDDGVVHADIPHTAYSDSSEIRGGDDPTNSLFAGDIIRYYPLQESSATTSETGTAHDFPRDGTEQDGTIDGATLDARRLRDLPTMDFDGTNDIIELPDGTPTSEFTVAAFIYPTEYGYGEFHSILSGGFDGTTEEWVLRHEESGDNQYEWFVFDSSRGGTVGLSADRGGVSDSNVALNTWHSIWGMYANGTYELEIRTPSTTYSDSVSSSISPADADNSSPWSIGGEILEGSPNRHFRGGISHAMMLSKKPTASERADWDRYFRGAVSHTAVYKGPSPSASPTASFSSVTIPPGTSATVEFLEDTDGDGTAENSDSLTMSDGVTDYTASGLSGNGDLALVVSLDNPGDLTAASLVEVPVEVS